MQVLDLRDLERVKREMDIPLPHIGEKNTCINKVIKLSVEPLVKVKKMSKKDILLAQKRVRDEYAKLVPRGNTSKKSAKTNQAKRPGLRKKSGHFNVKRGNANTIINVKLVNVRHLLAKHQHGMHII